MRPLISGAVAIGAAAFLVVACGGRFTSVDGNANQLSPTDQNQLCEDEYNYIASSFSMTATAKMSCLSSYTQGGNCQTAFQNCVSQAQAAGVFPPPDCAAFAQALANCNTTVRQYSDCVEQEVHALQSVEVTLPLCTQGAAESAYLDAEAQISYTCLNLMQTCPLVPGAPMSMFGGTSQLGGGDAGTLDGS